MQNQDHIEIQQQEIYSALLRSLSGEKTAQIRDWQVFVNSVPFGNLSPHLSLKNIHQDWSNPRGVIDGIALRLKHSDQSIHLALSPSSQVESFIFEVLEQIRVESLCPSNLKGMQQNIHSQFRAWLDQFSSRGGVEGSIGLLIFSISAIVWMNLHSASITQLQQDMIEATRLGLSQRLGPLIKQLKLNKTNQKEYSKISLQIAKLAATLIEAEYNNFPSLRTKRKNQISNLLKIEWIPPQNHHVAENSLGTGVSRNESFRFYKNYKGNYKVFNKTYDSEIKAQEKIRIKQLDEYLKILEENLSQQIIPWSKLSRLYQQIFISQSFKRWQTSESEGLIDRRYLIRSVTSPLQPMLYKARYPSQFMNTKMTLLVDCSGSMKEQRFLTAMCIDSLIRILDQIGIQTEVLGYSTNAWHGGRPFKEWKKKGSPPSPGRLNETAHWIFKDFATSWKKSRISIATLLRPEIYAESLDGEALLWATGRMLQQKKSNHLNHLILFSDGCPMDRATIEANGEDFLKDHLTEVISWCNALPQFNLMGCGIGQEMRTNFQHCLSWNTDEGSVSNILSNWASELKLAV